MTAEDKVEGEDTEVVAEAEDIRQRLARCLQEIGLVELADSQ